MNPLKFSVLSIFVFVYVGGFAKAQHLPNLPNKAQPQFENPSFCPPQGRTSRHADPDLNRKMNRVDGSTKYYFVAFNEIKTLPYPDGIGKKKRSDWSAEQTAAVAKYEGIPIVVQGYLMLTPIGHRMYGAKPGGSESCNCGRTEANHVDFHLWLVNAIGDSKRDSVVVEMTPRVRAHHSQWTVGILTQIASLHFPVRVYGWLMLDQDHPEQIGDKRATLWEIHPIIQLQFKQNGVWKTL